MITDVLMAKTIEFRVTIGSSSRIFHLGNASPLVFGLEEYLIGDDGQLIAKVRLISVLDYSAVTLIYYLYFEKVIHCVFSWKICLRT